MTTDTNIAVQENEMATIRAIFERVANTITAASDLAKEVANLRQQVQELAAEVAHIREQNQILEEALASTRQARDDLQRQVSDLTLALKESQASEDQWKKLANNHGQTIDGLYESIRRTKEAHESEVADLTKARDDALYHVVELEDHAKGLEVKLGQVATFHASMASIFGNAPSQGQGGQRQGGEGAVVPAPVASAPEQSEASPPPAKDQAVGW